MPWRHTEKWAREDHIGTTRKADVGALETHREVGAGRSHRNDEEG